MTRAFVMMLKRLLWLPILLIPLLPAAAQVTPGEDDPNRPALPDIAPQEVEIRGNLEINLPALRRQPLIGFNPPPRVREIPPSRRPYVEDYKQEQSDLPPSPLLQPDPPQLAAIGGGEPLNGQLAAGVGRYYSRFARGRVGAAFNEQVSAYGRVDYRGIAGFVPHEIDAPEVSYEDDDLAGTLGLQVATPGAVVNVEGTGFLDRYRMFALSSTAGLSDHPFRDLQGGFLTASVRTREAAATHAELRAEVGGLTWDLRDAPETTADRFSSEEQRLDLRGALGRTFGANTLRADGRFAKAGYADDGAATLFDAGAALHLRGRQAPFTFALGGRFLSYDVQDDRPGSPVSASRRAGYLAPDVRLDYAPSQQTQLYARTAPRAEANDLRSLLQENPYLAAEPEIQPTLYTVDAEAGLRVYAGPARISGFAGYALSPNYRFFENAPDLGFQSLNAYTRGLALVRYAEATILRFGGEASVVLPAGFNAIIGLTYRSGSLAEWVRADGVVVDLEGTDIPNFGPLLGHASLTYAFAERKGLIQLLSTFESSRYADLAQTRELDPYLDLDVVATYAVTEFLDVLGRVDNLSPLNERWDYAPAPPLVVGLGLQVRW